MADISRNNEAICWGDVSFEMFGNTVEGITKISYKVKPAFANNYGRGNRPISYGQGNEEYEGSIELYQEEVNSLLRAGKAVQGKAIKLHELPLTTAIIVMEKGEFTVVDEITFKFKNTDREFAQGETAAKMSCELHITNITLNV